MGFRYHVARHGRSIVKNRDPRDAWMIVQRICGVSYYHSRAVFRSCGRECAEYRRSG
ncbi:nickel-dependent hydrogenase large subunit [Escherichia coli]|nr:nickel-dependent hydrogenase large subunit [Escherichia coli]